VGERSGPGGPGSTRQREDIPVDIYCTRCGEPWELDTFHDVIHEQHGPGLATLEEQHYGPDGRDGGWTPERSRAFQADYERLYWNPMMAAFHADGCAATGWCDPCEPRRNGRTELAALAYELLGDDVDGIASFMADAEYLGVVE
jgi:hypothetical protein